MSFTTATSLIERFKTQKHQKFFETSSGKPIWNVLHPALNAVSQIQKDSPALDVQDCLTSLLAAVEVAEAHQSDEAYADLNQASNRLVVLVLANLGPTLGASMKRQKELTSSVAEIEGRIQDLSKTALATQNNWKEITKKLETDANEIVGKQQEDWEKTLSAASKLYENTKINTENAVRLAENEILKISSQSEEGLEILRNKLEAIEADSLSTSFISRAERERKTAEFLRWTSFILLLVVSVFVGYNIIGPGMPEPTWHILASRFLLVFTLMIPAGYASKEASRHFQRSEYYQQRGLGLQALQTDLAGLKEDEALEYKKHVWNQFFSNIDSGSAAGFAHGTEDLLRFLDKLKSIFSKSRDEPTDNS